MKWFPHTAVLLAGIAVSVFSVGYLQAFTNDQSAAAATSNSLSVACAMGSGVWAAKSGRQSYSMVATYCVGHWIGVYARMEIGV